MGHQQRADFEDFLKEAEEFEATKAGVKGLVDSGIKKIPKFFIQESKTLPNENQSKNSLQLPQVPIIDLQGIEDGFQRARILEEIREASEKWGFFQIINHGVSQNVMNAILETARRFHEQPKEAKLGLYSSEGKQKVRFFTINGLITQNHRANWRDVFACNFIDDTLDPEAIPQICRNDILDYMENMKKLRDLLSEILSEALGLNKDFLDRIDCLKSEFLTCNYYPACPEPDLTFGTFKHSDSSFLTVLVQDDMGGLQVMYQNDWIDVKPVEGALVVNIGELIQLITNDKFKSVEHRVLASYEGPRISVSCFFYPSSQFMMKPYGPIEELLSESNPAIYKEVTYLEYVTYYQKMIRERIHILSHFKLCSD